MWLALHKPNGSEFSDKTARGYRRQFFVNSNKAIMFPTITRDWGVVRSVSAWNSEVEGECIFDPYRVYASDGGDVRAATGVTLQFALPRQWRSKLIVRDSFLLSGMNTSKGG